MKGNYLDIICIEMQIILLTQYVNINNGPYKCEHLTYHF